jgi:hypothetical protein
MEFLTSNNELFETLSSCLGEDYNIDRKGLLDALSANGSKALTFAILLTIWISSWILIPILLVIIVVCNKALRTSSIRENCSEMPLQFKQFLKRYDTFN